MSYMAESDDQANLRWRKGRLVAFLCIAWWIASIGGIIFVLNTQA